MHCAMTLPDTAGGCTVPGWQTPHAQAGRLSQGHSVADAVPMMADDGVKAGIRSRGKGEIELLTDLPLPGTAGWEQPLPLGPDGLLVSGLQPAMRHAMLSAAPPLLQHGVLANGVTYYVRQCAKPAGRVALALAVKIGRYTHDVVYNTAMCRPAPMLPCCCSHMSSHP